MCECDECQPDAEGADLAKSHFLFRRGMLQAARAGQEKSTDAKKQYDSADEDFRASQQILNRILGPEHYYTINCRLHQALAWHDRGELGKAGTQLKQCLDDYRKKLSANHPTVVVTRALYADNLLARAQRDERKTDLFAEAEKEARAILAEVRDDRVLSRSRAVARYVLGAALVAQNKDDAEAERHLLAAYEALTGKKPASGQGYIVAETCSSLVKLYRARGAPDGKTIDVWEKRRKEAGTGRPEIPIGK